MSNDATLESISMGNNHDVALSELLSPFERIHGATPLAYADHNSNRSQSSLSKAESSREFVPRETFLVR
ncbi:hypothetical protein J2R76_003810 [Bradyrhizobium sp. USDA 4532]|uniref:hypothetical protein n=1 Tax=unclassified Bradyrhizobium TaxID=2631580 RepID=UPI00209E870F|nr:MULTISPECIES: hypothetical protein [unclassified Bradyrhizobium]MCP1835473.1 hypothetical protein [Bradyrhizobium sp. USDA 4545]MCP1920219.1 hypothetical protein [Bradyrhizobium sp. USDA 4532]